MITTIKKGYYHLIETRHKVKILYLDTIPYAWIPAKSIGEIIILSSTLHQTEKSLSMGRYIIYSVEDEPHLTDLEHLELEYAPDIWQGYLLPTGMPTIHKKISRIIPTYQVITGNPNYTAIQPLLPTGITVKRKRNQSYNNVYVKDRGWQ